MHPSNQESGMFTFTTSYCIGIQFRRRLFLLAFLTVLFRPSVATEISTKPSDIIEDVKDLLIRKGNEESIQNGSPTQYDDIVAQIISLLNCGHFPLSPNSHLDYSLDYATKYLRFYQACDRYFKTSRKNESLQVECKYKNWIFTDIECEKTTCPRLAVPPGGHISTKNNTYNTTVYFWCSRGFSIKGKDKLFCEESGVWNLPQPTCEVSYCHPLPSPRYGFVSSQEKTPVNQTVEFTCGSEYTLIGDAILGCQDDGRWNTTAPVCKKMCTVSNTTGQTESVRLVPELKQIPIGSILQQGQRIIFSCKLGYIVTSSELSTCIGGAWRPPIRCKKTCDAVVIDNGEYTLSKDYSTIEYSCLPGYQLIGHQKLSCTPDTTWDSEIPICTKLCTLRERRQVLSYRHKGTYKVIHPGTHIVNGTQVYPICRSSTQQNTTASTCVDGILKPHPCTDPRSRLDENGYLELLFNGIWQSICKQVDVCEAFGFITASEMATSYNYEGCFSLDTDTYLRSSQISVDRTYSNNAKCY